MQQHPSQQRLPLVRLTTLGPFVLERLHMQAGHEPTYTTLTSKEIHGRGKVLTMLKILLCQRHRRATRDKLIDLLWTEDEQHEMKDVRGALKTMAVVLRDFLRVGSDESLLITISPSDELMLAGQDAIWVDADAFEALVQQAVRVPAADALPLWERAHALAGGEFLADEPYSEWATPRREALHGKMGQCTVALADLYTAPARLDLAQEILWDAATAEYPNEDALCRLLLLLERQERYHDAWNLYKNTKREFAKYERKLSSRVRELGIRIREKLEGIEPYTVINSTTNNIIPMLTGSEVPALSSHPHSTIPLLGNSSTVSIFPSLWNALPEQQEGMWLIQGAGYLGQLFAYGWSMESLFDSLKIVLQGVQAMPTTMQKQLLQSTAPTMVSSIPLLMKGHVSEEERAQVSQKLGESIGDAWKFFHSSDAGHLLAVGQSLLCLVQTNHSLLYPQMLPTFYSTIYMLIGATLYVLGRYEEAQYALEKSYIASLESANAWLVAQVVSWQAYVYEARKQHILALQATDRALRIISQQEGLENIRLRVRLLALSAEILALLRNVPEVKKRLDSAGQLVSSLSLPHEEFDQVSWLQHRGTCALHLGQYTVAVQQLQQSLSELPPEWKLRYLSTSISLVKALIYTKEPKKAIEISEKALPIIKSVQATVFASKLMEYLQNDLIGTFPEEKSYQTFVIEMRRRLAVA